MDAILAPIVTAFAWIWVQIHSVLVFLGFPDGPGFAWALSIILLTILVRLAIIPLYLKQIRSTRNMQMLQPQLQKINAKYKGKKDQVSRQRQQEETMALYKKNGTSPFASCLPMLVQMPVLFALYRVIYAVPPLMEGTYRGGSVDRLGPLTQSVAFDIDTSTVMGVGLSQSMGTAPSLAQKAVFVVLIVVMVLLQFFTMRLSMTKNMASTLDPNNPMMRSQKTMVYLMPLMYVFTGLVFTMGMLMYMVTTAVFSFLQQYWVVRVMPTPGAPAYQELTDRREKGYKAWAVPVFEDYDARVEELGTDAAAIETLNQKTLTKVQRAAKKQKVNSDFPEDWDAAARVEVYRTLAVEPWKHVPDELWMKQLVLQKNSQAAAEAARANRPRKLSREQRMRLAERERQELEAAERRARKQERKVQDRASKGGNLSPEEIERRRAARRAERRAQNKAAQNKKQNEGDSQS